MSTGRARAVGEGPIPTYPDVRRETIRGCSSAPADVCELTSAACRCRLGWARDSLFDVSAMKPGFEPGIIREITVTVTEDMCPAFDGAIVHHLYSTWCVVHHMEIAARKILVDFLEDDEEGIGAHVSVDHLAPCRVGKTVRVRAELVEVAHDRVVCEVTAYDGERLLAKGKQVQIVMNKEALAGMIERS